MLEKVKIANVALYSADRENFVRAYVACFKAEISDDAPKEKFTVIGFFSERDGKWVKESNENCTLENLLTAMNEGTELMADTKQSQIPALFEASFVFGQ